MSYLPLDQMTYKDGPQLDAFNGLRVSQGTTLMGSSQEYNFHPLLMDHYTASGGTATHAVLTNSTVLRTNATTSGARALRQSKIYVRYTPGKSQLIKLTGTLRKSGTASGTAFAGIGYYDDDNGVFFRYSSTGVAVVVRSNVSGSVVNTAVAQASWNMDKFDGTGPSGITVDWTKEQIFIVDFQWLGVGRVRVGLVVSGALRYCHEFYHANLTTAVYMRTANLPVRYEVFNSGGAGADISLEAVCFAVESEGGTHEDDFYSFCYSAYVASPVSLDTTMRPYVTRRIRDTFGGITCRGHAHLNSFDLLVGTNNIYWEIRYNATLTIGGVTTTTDVDTTNPISEYDTYTGTNTVTGGVVVMNGFAVPGSGSNKGILAAQNLGSRPLLGRTYAGVRDTYTLCARTLTGAATMSVAVQLQEQY